MPWVRIGDTSAGHPITLAPLEWIDCDDRLVNELFGFVMRCAAQAGAHVTDYVVSRGTAVLMAGMSRVDILLSVAVFAGYMTEIVLDDGRVAYKLVDTDHDFLHLRLKEEIDWERQQKQDNSNPALIIPVRLRDGDACRWCGNVVNWTARNGGRNGTYDHLEPGNKQTTVQTVVVSCGSCNAARGNGNNIAGNRTLLPEPTDPYFSKYTVDWIKNHRWAQNNRIDPPSPSRKAVDPGKPAPYMAATSKPGLSPAAAASSTSAGERPGNQPEHARRSNISDTPATRTDSQSAHAPSTQRSEIQSENAQNPGLNCDNAKPGGILQDLAGREPRNPASPGRVGSGRDGSGRDGRPGISGDDFSKTDPSRKPTRGRRRRRPRGSSSTASR